MSKIKIHQERCKACGLCIISCPQKLLSFSSEINAQGFTPVKIDAVEKCKSCAFCALMCPDVCIEVWKE